METLILKALRKGFGGVVEFCPLSGRLKISYSIFLPGEGIYKLYVLSSLRPSAPPVVAHTPEVYGHRATGSAVLSPVELACKGYDLGDIDTFVIAEKLSQGAMPVAVGFSRLLWDFSPAFITPGATTLLRAEDILRPREEDFVAYKILLDKIHRFADNLGWSLSGPLKDFAWYDTTVGALPGLSGLTHITDAMPGDTELLFGLKEGGYIALAFRPEWGPALFNVEDCVLARSGYLVVGLRLKEEGQFFFLPEG